MTIRNLEGMFHPKSLALVGVSTKPRSVGHVLMENVLASGFEGPIMPVNPKYQSVGGILTYPDINSLPLTPDLAVLTIGAQHIPQTIADLGARGTKAVVIISAGFGETGTEEGKKLEQDMLAAARPHTMRIIGPNCVGIMVPGAKLNASFAHVAPSAGSLAFISQSGALCTAVLDTVAERDIGFSHFISLGNASDVDFGDMLDYLASDPKTSAILLYIESVSAVRKFMSAGRAASRNKPVIVIKSGRNQAGAKAAASHTGALIGSDGVYDVAFRRAGMLRVYDMEELFDAVETLARITKAGEKFNPRGHEGDEALTIVTNGGGPAVLATDYLVAQGGRLAELSQKTVEALNVSMPPSWSHGNPVDIIGDADGKRYKAALDVVMGAPETESVFVMKCPTAVSDNMEAARAVIETAAGHDRLMLTCWLGDATAGPSRHAFAQAGIPTYETPEKAVRAFLHINRFRQGQTVLQELPCAVCHDFASDKKAAQAIIEGAFRDGRSELFENEAKDVLAAYSIPVVKTVTAGNPEEAVAAAERIGFPVALKILSPDISHKTDVGGVMLNLGNAKEVRAAAVSMLENVAKLRPKARLEGFTVQQMVAMREGYELIIGVSTDRQFGPVIMFGEGGVAVEVIDDKALGLPPINQRLADDMVKSTRVYRRLKGFRDHKPVDMQVIINTLVQVSQLVTDIADISELDINPLVVDHHGAIALDARIKIVRSKAQDGRHLAISAYPQELEEKTGIKGREVHLRPVRPDDAQSLQDMIAQLTPQDMYQRFYGEYPVLADEQVARLTHIDYDREMVFVAVPADEHVQHAPSEMYACLLCTMHPDSDDAEFTIVVRSDMKGMGLGHALTQKIITYLQTIPRIASISGYTLPGNDSLIDMVQNLGFSAKDIPAKDGNPAMVKVSRALR